MKLLYKRKKAFFLVMFSYQGIHNKNDDSQQIRHNKWQASRQAGKQQKVAKPFSHIKVKCIYEHNVDDDDDRFHHV